MFTVISWNGLVRALQGESPIVHVFRAFRAKEERTRVRKLIFEMHDGSEVEISSLPVKNIKVEID